MSVSRRHFITGLSSLSLMGSPLFNARAEGMAKRNLVVIMLRGGMDGLTAVPSRDSILGKARPDIMVDSALSLTADFQLHPQLKRFHELWGKGQASVVHATNIPYTNRSHFEGQDVMQSGGHVPYGDKTGWLGRGLKAAQLEGVALSLPMPLLLRGGTTPDNFYPAQFQMPRDLIIDKVASSYHDDHDIKEMMDKIRARPRSMSFYTSSNVDDLARQAADQLARDEGPRVAVFDIGGFDTHAAQGGSDGEHGEKLREYDRVLNRLTRGLGGALDNTLIVTLTEFGRKLHQNGGYGTEHGYGTAILMAGGLVKQSQVFADWPGLSRKNLYEGQDLMATIDARSVYCSAMAACFDTDFEALRRGAFYGDPLVDLTDRLFKV